jgi:hypothetical protein
MITSLDNMCGQFRPFVVSRWFLQYVTNKIGVIPIRQESLVQPESALERPTSAPQSETYRGPILLDNQTGVRSLATPVIISAQSTAFHKGSKSCVVERWIPWDNIITGVDRLLYVFQHCPLVCRFTSNNSCLLPLASCLLPLASCGASNWPTNDNLGHRESSLYICANSHEQHSVNCGEWCSDGNICLVKWCFYLVCRSDKISYNGYNSRLYDWVENSRDVYGICNIVDVINHGRLGCMFGLSYTDGDDPLYINSVKCLKVVGNFLTLSYCRNPVVCNNQTKVVME